MDRAETLITPDMTINALLDANAQAAAVLVAHGMACVGCPLDGFHTLAEAAVIYGQDLETFLSELCGCLSGKSATLSGERSG